MAFAEPDPYNALACPLHAQARTLPHAISPKSSAIGEFNGIMRTSTARHRLRIPQEGWLERPALSRSRLAYPMREGAEVLADHNQVHCPPSSLDGSLNDPSQPREPAEASALELAR